MRIWSLHPIYLDRQGLTACWRETLLAKAVLCAQTRGYTNHPQLDRFKACSDPLAAINVYLRGIHAEASRRGYNFDASKFDAAARARKINVTDGQLEFEFAHLIRKLETRSPAWLATLDLSERVVHPSFKIINGGIAEWERP